LVSVGVAVAALAAYVALLFCVAEWGEKSAAGRRLAAHPVVFSLGLAVYCTTWTFYGSVGKAASSGMGYLPVYLGPTLALLFGAHVYRRIIRLKQAHRLTSIADFISARYGKSQAVAAVVTAALLVGIIPYIALQLKAVTGSFRLLTAAADGSASPYVAWFSPLSVVMMVAFTIAFGIRHLDPTERHPGMVVSVAVESFVKLAAFIAAGVAIVKLAFGGVDGFLRGIDAEMAALPLAAKSSGNDVLSWITVTLLSMAAFAFLPRQFHQGVVEAGDAKQVRVAQWLAPLYLVAINVLVVPIALGGRLIGAPGTSADLYVLALPLQAGRSALSIMVFVGGFSAAIGMIMIETMTMATMVSNHLLLPVIQAHPRLRFLQRHILYTRWVAAALVIGGGYGFEAGIGSSYPLVAIGLISFAAAFLLAPLVLGGLFWPGATKGGALLGLGAGFATWFYTLLLPTFVKAGWIGEAFLKEGPWGLAWLRPEALFGLAGLPALSHGTFFSIGATILMYITGSMLFPAGKEERQLTEAFLDPAANQFAHLDDKNANIDAADKRARTRELFAEYFPEAEIEALIERCWKAVGITGRERLTVVELAELQSEVGRTLAGAIGAASAHNAMKQFGAQLGTIDRKDQKSLVHEFARTLAQLKLSPREIKQRIDFQAEREKLLDDQFRQMQAHIEELNVEVAERQKAEAALRIAHDKLEERVRERTREIQTILDNVTFGFLVVDRNLEVQPGFTVSCRELFGTSEIVGRPLTELLGVGGTASAKNLQLSIDAFFEDILPEEVLAAQLPHRFSGADGRVLHVDARTIRDDARAVEKLLLTISDITELGEAEYENERNRAIIGILREKEAFRRFLRETRDRIDNARRMLERDSSVVRREIHTIKGNAAAYGIKEIVSLVHAIEEKSEIGAADLDRIERAFQSFLHEHHQVLAISFEHIEEESYAVSRDHFALLGSIIERIDPSKAAALRRWTADVLRRPARALLGPLGEFVAKLGERLGKKVDFVLEGGDLLVHAETLGPVLMTITHVVRNAVDHGLEAASQRKDKPKEGRLAVRLAETADEYVIVVEDDGRGIDVDNVCARARLIGAVDERALAAMSERARLELIFLDGLSTADATTDISGRGVGMSAVKSAVLAAGGTIAIATRRGQGTRFEMRVPKPAELRSGSATPAIVRAS
jgi:Na+/proline symporter/HPt (histidine-containing phosphotransfer) domain-containing protein/PAS domain-containing protein